MKIEPNLLTKWLAALRSGDYEQGKDYLYKDGKYCCIGVLCSVAGIPNKHMDGVTTISHLHLRREERLITADDTREFQCKLERMNDGVESGRQETFSEIANFIEVNVRG